MAFAMDREPIICRSCRDSFSKSKGKDFEKTLAARILLQSDDIICIFIRVLDKLNLDFLMNNIKKNILHRNSEKITMSHLDNVGLLTI